METSIAALFLHSFVAFAPYCAVWPQTHTDDYTASMIALHLKRNLTALGGAGEGWTLQETEPSHCCSSSLNLLASLLNVLVGNTHKWQPNNGGECKFTGADGGPVKRRPFQPVTGTSASQSFHCLYCSVLFTAHHHTIPPSFFLVSFTTIPSSLRSKSGPIFILPVTNPRLQARGEQRRQS